MKHLSVFLTSLLFVAISFAQTVAFVNASDEANHLNNPFLPEYLQSDGAEMDHSDVPTASAVISAVVSVSPAAVSNCEGSVKRFTFTARIETNGPGTIRYKWLRSDGAIDSYAPRMLHFRSAGTQEVSTTWDLSPTNFEGWQAIEVLTPHSFISNEAHFSLSCNRQNCIENPWKLTPCANALLQSFKDLVAGSGVCYYGSSPLPTVRSTMPEQCYMYYPGSGPVSGAVSFASWYFPGDLTPDFPSSFRVNFGSIPENYTYYGICPPDPISHSTGLNETHVYCAKLVRESVYRATPPTTHFSAIPCLRPSDIAAIGTCYIEPTTGYIASSNAVQYNNVLSAQGIAVKVVMRGTGEEVLCYLITNYDYDLTPWVTWKERNDCK